MNKKTNLFFGPPLALLTQSEKNTLLISGKVNRTAERYLEILREHGLTLTDSERECLVQVCGIGYLSPEDIHELADEVRFSEFSAADLDKEALAVKLEAASFADLVATIETLGF